MRKLALNDEILMKIEKPARYIGNEVNAVMKDKDQVKVRFAMCFPDVYEIGMSHLGIQIIYDMLNKFEDVWCERVYSPWVDLDAVMRKEHIPLFALESQDPVKDFDFLGITIQYEMCYTNILQILDLSGIPLLSKDRTEDDPIVIGGGPCTYNPEPICDFFDLFYIGEGETRYRELLDLYKDCKACGLSRKDFLKKAAMVPGMYVPSLYDVKYKEDGTIDQRILLESGIPEIIEKEMVTDVSDTYYPDKPVVPFIKVTQDRVVLEIQRGCIRGCRFCQAGQLYRPVRERSVEMLKHYAVEMLKNTGHEEISLSSLSSSDYSKLPELLDFLIESCDKKKINISLPSLRIDAFSLDVMNKVQDVKKSSLTFAPEAGSQRLRNVINKGLTEEVILEGARLAFEGGWTRVKLYFMLGLPMETDEDIREIAELCNKIAAVFYETVPKEKRTGRVQIVASTSFFIPKPFTPFQWASQRTKEEFLDKAYLTRTSIAAQLNQKSIKYNWHEADVSVLEGIMARGDRRLNQVILKAYQKGCIYDAWSEYYKNDVWMQTFEECGINPDFYTTRERRDDEIFPWDFLDCGVTKEFLLREWHRAKQETVTPNCRMQCNGCGAARYGTGVCLEKREEACHEG
ncbi:MAG: TIGR03960 family B12-binding radical SAM protein [Firmicutes bacterium]|nr:TIGR03960 family B12-binding radical SAM protein [Bacillota bacterium]